ncbi:erythrocyte membrane antigen 1 [Plasmodium vinckei lentum]|uniref:Erythrocyte membrane antigen 1 n=1 Tax=Plasmodium vinckei lentum TaxID=138297 RepID=A0A6V7S7M6_PLAVN|nr:erythrocyte membrane antigen 1 [Plasmodium vinckei lentum]
MSYDPDLPNLKFIDEFSPIISEIYNVRQTELVEPFISETDGAIVNKVTGFLRRENDSRRKGWYIRPYEEDYEHMIKVNFMPLNKNDQSFQSNQTNVHKQCGTPSATPKAAEKRDLPKEQKLSTINEEDSSALHEDKEELDKENENKSEDEDEELDEENDNEDEYEELNEENDNEDKDEELDRAYMRALSFLDDEENDNEKFKENIAKLYHTLKMIRRKRRRNEENENKGEELDKENGNEDDDEELDEENGNEDDDEELDEENGNEDEDEELDEENDNEDEELDEENGNEDEELDEENGNEDEELDEENDNEDKDEELDEENGNEDEDKELNEENDNEDKDEELDRAYMRALSFLDDEENGNEKFKESIARLYHTLKIIRRKQRR